MRIDKVKWITARSCGKQKWHSFASIGLTEKGKFWNSTLSHKLCPRKQTTGKKTLLILVSFFSEEVTSYTYTRYCIHILWEICRSVFHGPHCIEHWPWSIIFYSLSLHTSLWYVWASGQFLLSKYTFSAKRWTS